MNPIARKILDAGGTILKEPLTNEDGSINEKCIDELDKELKREPVGSKINHYLSKRKHEKET